jgi:hypothetical protein
MNIRDYSEGYAEGQRIAEFFDERDVPDPQFEDHRRALYRKGWWDGFNKLEFDPGGQGLFHQPTDEELLELYHRQEQERERELDRE